ncbi:MAG: hypothetical protein IT353_10340 [Gemmatimonadaceae bacterium]|nr:hypothetical protein [Gemmatimonadaceae bacterium]
MLATHARWSVLLCAHLLTGVSAVTLHAQTPRRVYPGDTTLRGSALRADTLTYTLTGYRDGDEIPVGTITDVFTRVEGKIPRWRRVMVVQRGTSRLTDSTTTDIATMAPVDHYSWQPQREITLQFQGARVRGRIGQPNTPGVAFDTTIALAAFDSGNWDLVVRAMPLAADYQAIFPVYDIESGAHNFGVRVIGQTPMYGETAHVVIFQLGGQREITVWVGATTRRLLQVETPLGPTTILRQALREQRPQGRTPSP